MGSVICYLSRVILSPVCFSHSGDIGILLQVFCHLEHFCLSISGQKRKVKHGRHQEEDAVYEG